MLLLPVPTPLPANMKPVNLIWLGISQFQKWWRPSSPHFCWFELAANRIDMASEWSINSQQRYWIHNSPFPEPRAWDQSCFWRCIRSFLLHLEMNGQLIARRPLLDRQGLDLCEGIGGTSMSNEMSARQINKTSGGGLEIATYRRCGFLPFPF
jgi:hypothetical protein